MIRLERNETRAEKRRTLAELAREMERGRLGLSSEPTLSDDEHDNDGANAMDIEGEAAAATDADIIVMSSHFEGDNLTTTVVVEEMGNGMAALNNALGLARTLHQRQSANLDDSEEESEDDNPFAIQQTDDDAAPKQPAKRKRVFKYESKAERKQLRSDQLVKAKATKERKDRKAQPARVSKKKINGGRK
ncbi:hypothetical protein BC828DRAFT_389124 [Blastocladiella britannica]|nr:hypothetical protein BC828DRAFT_389124 [Blastocladiella britannica]